MDEKNYVLLYRFRLFLLLEIVCIRRSNTSLSNHFISCRQDINFALSELQLEHTSLYELHFWTNCVMAEYPDTRRRQALTTDWGFRVTAKETFHGFPFHSAIGRILVKNNLNYILMLRPLHLKFLGWSRFESLSRIPKLIDVFNALLINSDTKS